MKYAEMKTKEDRWCEIEIEYDTERDRLSICGEEGSILTRNDAEGQAIQYWESFFECEPGSLGEMQQRFPDACLHTAEQGAAFVVETDGSLHGVDVHKEDGDRIYISESCGQITGTIRDWFPEYADLLPWHLNDMRAGCEHQDARGQRQGKCPECGYRYGSAWLKRDLPLAIVEKLRGLGLVAA